MDDRIASLYRLPDIAKYEDVHLQTLRENCAVLESQVYDLMEHLSESSRQILEAYIDMRNDLELESVKAALRWGKDHHK